MRPSLCHFPAPLDTPNPSGQPARQNPASRSGARTATWAGILEWLSGASGMPVRNRSERRSDAALLALPAVHPVPRKGRTASRQRGYGCARSGEMLRLNMTRHLRRHGLLLSYDRCRTLSWTSESARFVFRGAATAGVSPPFSPSASSSSKDARASQPRSAAVAAHPSRPRRCGSPRRSGCLELTICPPQWQQRAGGRRRLSRGSIDLRIAFTASVERTAALSRAAPCDARPRHFQRLARLARHRPRALSLAHSSSC